jgi:serine/threonine-protein kinase
MSKAYVAPRRASRRGLIWGLIIAVVVLATTLAACSDEERVTVPDVVGMEEAEAKEALTGAELELGEITYEQVAATSQELNIVLSQEPSAGTEVDAGTKVALVVAQGPEDTPGGEGTGTPSPGGTGGGSGSGVELKPDTPNVPQMSPDPPQLEPENQPQL